MMPSNESFFIVYRHHLASFILLLALLAGFTQSGSVTAEMPSTEIERLEATDAGLCPATIEFGETIQCSIDNPSEVDSYTFTADANDKVLVRMSRVSGNLYAGIRVYDSNGSELCENNGSLMAEITSCDLEAGGTVTILAYDSQNGTHTGDYDLYLQRLNNPGQALSINFGLTLSDSIDSPSKVDTYILTPDANDKVLVRMSRAEGGLLPGIRVYDSNGNKLCEENGTYSAEIASCDLEAGGTVTILAYSSHISADTGDYGLYLQRLNNPGKTLPINFGEVISDSIDTPSEMDSYTFTADTNDKVLVRMNRTSGNLYVGIRVYDSDGSKLCEENGGNFAEIASCDLEIGGTVIILAYDSLNGTHTGDYNLSLTCLTPPCDPPATTPTSTPTATMSPTVTSTSTPTISPTATTPTSTPTPVSPTATVSPASLHKIYLPTVQSG